MTASPNLINSRQEITKCDPQNVLGSIEALADQVRHAWQETQKVKIALNKPIQNIVLAGMGGSALGASVVKHLFMNQLKQPFEIVNDYLLPRYINQNSLVILSSYSGDTEEIIECAQEAKKKNAQILVITSGGKLARIAKENGYTHYLIEAEHNPSNQPRMAIGYAVVGLIGLLNKANLLKVGEAQIEKVVEVILTTSHLCTVETEPDQNPAKSLTFTLVDRRPNLVAAEFLSGAVHVASNQFNENAKTFASHYKIPEIDHHLLESLEFPRSNQSDNIFVFINSDLYHPRNQIRMELTQQAVERQGVASLSIKMQATTQLEQVFELITLTSFANFYLAIINQINPSEIPIVDWFKDELKKAKVLNHKTQ